jgi:hypothetical protein
MNRAYVVSLLLALAAAFCTLVPGSSQTAGNGARQAHVRQTPLDVVWADPRNMMYSSGLTESERLVAAAAFHSNITVTYDAGFAAVPSARAAFQAAVDTWRTVISSPATIRITASYGDLGNPGLLGAAGPSVLCTVSGGVGNTFYAAALADKLNGSPFCAGLGGQPAEINAFFNSTFTNWDFGTTGAPVAGKYNFMTVVMHEIGHGLGLFGSMRASGGIGSYRSTPDIYDRFAVTGANAPLLGFVNPSAALGTQLVSNDTYFNGPLARSQNGNNRPKLETHNFTTAFGISSDNGWRQGSSYSHVDDVIYSGTPNGLMTFALGQAEVYTDPGPIVRGILADQGWGSATLGSDPLLTIDTPSDGGAVGPTFTVSGWALDRLATTGTGIDQVHVWAYPATGGAGVPLGAATYGQSRADVGAAFGSQFNNSGFTFTASGMSNGGYTVTVYGRNTTTGTFNVAASRSITVSGPVPNPAITLDRPLTNGISGSTVTASGWAIDRGAPSGTGVDQVHVWAFPTAGGSPIALGVATYGLSRPDVGSAFGNSRFTNSGFQIAAPLPPGNYTITAYMHSTLTGTFSLTASAANVTVNATSSNPQMLIDTPSPNASRARPFTLSGWAVDTGAASGTGIDAIHVWAFPVGGGQSFVGVATYGLARPDVGAYLGGSQFNNSGYSITIDGSNLPAAGVYDFYVFAHSTVTGTFPIARIVRVIVS